MNMKIKRLLLTFLFVAVGGLAIASQHQGKAEKMKHSDAQMMQDSEKYSAMMDRIANDPNLRRQMLQKMMQAMGHDTSGMQGNMAKMMKDPEIQKRMKTHMEMMGAMMDGQDRGKAHMKTMMNDPEMKDMMRMHRMCMETMMAGKDSTGHDMMGKMHEGRDSSKPGGNTEDNPHHE